MMPDRLAVYDAPLAVYCGLLRPTFENGWNESRRVRVELTLASLARKKDVGSPKARSRRLLAASPGGTARRRRPITAPGSATGLPQEKSRLEEQPGKEHR